MKKYQNGIYIGKFFPLHLGHVSAINKLQEACEKCFVIFYNNAAAEEKLKQQLGVNYSVSLRMQDAKNIFKNNSNVIIEQITVPDSFTFPNDAAKIKALVEKVVGGNLDVQIFGAEEKEIYLPYKYANHYILSEMFSAKSPNGLPVSLHASLIRNNYNFYKQYLPAQVQQTLDKLKNQKIICVAGHSASGKSSFCKLLCEKFKNGIVVDIDKLAHKSHTSDFIKREVLKEFGEVVFNNGEIDRKKLGEIVFSDQAKKDKLYALTWVEMQQNIEEVLNQNYDVVILDWFLLPEKDYWKNCHARILVTASDELRKSRAVARDNITSEYYEKRNSNKYDYSTVFFNYVVTNNGAINDLTKNVNAIYKDLLENLF